MPELINKANTMQKRADAILQQTNVREIWQEIGAEVNLVGSLAMGLMLKHRDIDMHIYSDPFLISESFKAAGRLAEQPGIQSMAFVNLLEAEDRCLEWHAFYLDESGETWQLDLIHIRKDSPYVGYFEKVAEQIKAALTVETRTAILSIKQAVPDDEKVMGIRIYRSVLEGGVRDLAGFRRWVQEHPSNGIEHWMP